MAIPTVCAGSAPADRRSFFWWVCSQAYPDENYCLGVFLQAYPVEDYLILSLPFENYLMGVFISLPAENYLMVFLSLPVENYLMVVSCRLLAYCLFFSKSSYLLPFPGSPVSISSSGFHERTLVPSSLFRSSDQSLEL